MKNVFIYAIIGLSLAACATTPPTVAELCGYSTIPAMKTYTEQTAAYDPFDPSSSGMTFPKSLVSITRSPKDEAVVDNCSMARQQADRTSDKYRQYSIFLAESYLLDRKNPTAALSVLDDMTDTFREGESNADDLAIRAGFIRAVALFQSDQKDKAMAVTDALVESHPYATALHTIRLSMILSAETPDFVPVKAIMALDNNVRPIGVLIAQVRDAPEDAIDILNAMIAMESDQKWHDHNVESQAMALYSGQSVDRAFFETVLETGGVQYNKQSVLMAHAALLYLAHIDGNEEKKQHHLSELQRENAQFPTLMILNKLRKMSIAETGQSALPPLLTPVLLDRVYRSATRPIASVITSPFKLGQVIAELPRHNDRRKGSSYTAKALILKDTGFSSQPGDEPDTVNVKFASNAATPKMSVDEMTLLHAAELTKKAGKSHFLIRDKIDQGLTRTIRYTYSSTSFTSLNGYRTSYEVIFTDMTPDSPYAKAAPFMLSADKVIAELGPHYRN